MLVSSHGNLTAIVSAGVTRVIAAVIVAVAVIAATPTVGTTPVIAE